MEFSSSHRYDRPVEQVTEMFLDPDAHVGRYELMGHRDIEILEVSKGDGTLDLKTVRTVEGEVPKMAQKLIKATNTITTTDHWELTGTVLSGHSVIEASNVPGTATIAATIESAGESASLYSIGLTLDLKVPLIGERFITLMRPKVMEIVDAEFEAWDRWLSTAQVV